MFLLLTVASRSAAQEIIVPIGTQVELVAKLVAYDRNFRARSGDLARVMIVTKKADADSARMSGLLAAEFAKKDFIGGLPHEESVVEYTDASSLADACRGHRVSLVYLTAGLANEIVDIGRALDGVDTLTVGAVSGYAMNGAVVDLFVEGGKTRIALNLTQARKQHVAFPADLIRITRVIQ